MLGPGEGIGMREDTPGVMREDTPGVTREEMAE